MKIRIYHADKLIREAEKLKKKDKKLGALGTRFVDLEDIIDAIGEEYDNYVPCAIKVDTNKNGNYILKIKKI